MAFFNLDQLFDAYICERIKHSDKLEKFVFTLKFFIKHMSNILANLYDDIESVKKEDKIAIAWFFKLIQEEIAWTKEQLNITDINEFFLQVWRNEFLESNECKKYLQIESFVLKYQNNLFNTMGKKRAKKKSN